MSRLYCLISLLCMAAGAQASGSSALVFTDTICDIGYIAVDGGRQTCTFECFNDGETPVSIVGARSSCGCTVPSYPTTPIEPGEKAVVTVTYDPAGRPTGEFEKSITIVTTATPHEVKLYIKGEAFSMRSTPY